MLKRASPCSVIVHFYLQFEYPEAQSRTWHWSTHAQPTHNQGGLIQCVWRPRPISWQPTRPSDKKTLPDDVLTHYLLSQKKQPNSCRFRTVPLSVSGSCARTLCTGCGGSVHTPLGWHPHTPWCNPDRLSSEALCLSRIPARNCCVIATSLSAMSAMHVTHTLSLTTLAPHRE